MMRHPYSTNSTERRQVPLYLAILAVLTSLAAMELFAKIAWTPPAYVDVSSVMLIYGLYFEFFKRVAWKWKWLRSLGVVSTPILEGTWIGTIQSDFDGENHLAHHVEVTIGQDWTDILVRLHGPKSHSHSVSGSMVVTEDECVLIYDYLNEPNPDAEETMQMHRGTARLVLTASDELDGAYYSGRGRKNTGGVKLHRKK